MCTNLITLLPDNSDVPDFMVNLCELALLGETVTVLGAAFHGMLAACVVRETEFVH